MNLLDPTARPVIGHRGNAAHAPENTLESFRQAIAAGADAFEFDVRVTADGVPVLMHDPTVDRTTNGTGPVEALTLAQLRALDAGARFTADGTTFPYRGRGIAPPTLEEVLGAFAVPFMIEIKTPAASAAVRNVIERMGLEQRCVVASFVDHALGAFQRSRIPVASSMGEARRLYLRALLRRPITRPPFSCMSIPRWYKGLPLPLGGYARGLAPHGVPVHVWTVDDPDDAAALWRAGVRGIVTNDPRAMVEGRRGVS